MLAALDFPENTERYQRVAKFVDALFSRIEEFSKPPRHPKWKEASITAIIPGWQRFKAAQDWLDRWHEQHLGALSSFKAQQGHANLSQEELEKLYGQFLEWNRRVKN